MLFLPVGALLGGLTQPTAAVRAGLVTATVLWAGLNLDDYGALRARFAPVGGPTTGATRWQALESRGLQTLWGDFRLAYVLSFRSQERLRVASTTVHRIDEYVRRAAERDVPMVKQGICANGTELVTGIWLCPPPPPEARPPVY